MSVFGFSKRVQLKSWRGLVGPNGSASRDMELDQGTSKAYRTYTIHVNSLQFRVWNLGGKRANGPRMPNAKTSLKDMLPSLQRRRWTACPQASMACPGMKRLADS